MATTKPWRRNLSRADFSYLSELVHDITGIKLPEQKRTMMEARLQKRLRQLGMETFTDYCDHVASEDRGSAELIELVNIMTTNKTDFFREPDHFEVLFTQVLPVAAQRAKAERRPVRIWSAGCSTGEEPYTIAMVLSEFAAANDGMEWEVIATDISTRVLGLARQAVYRGEQVEPIPYDLLRRHFLRHKDSATGLYRIAPELRSRVRFEQLNLIHDKYSTIGRVDAVFCRNTVMYFEVPVSNDVIARLSRQLPHGGCLFLGHAEMRADAALPVKMVAPAVYQKP